MNAQLISPTTFILFLSIGIFSCSQPIPKEKQNHIEISDAIIWNEGEELVFKYLNALAAETVSLYTSEAYDNENDLEVNDLILIIRDSQKIRNKTYDEQLAIARKLFRIIYGELAYPEYYTAMQVNIYDDASNLIVQDTHQMNE